MLYSSWSLVTRSSCFKPNFQKGQASPGSSILRRKTADPRRRESDSTACVRACTGGGGRKEMGVSKIERTVYRKLLAEERVVTFGLCAGARGHSDVGYEDNHRVLIFCKRSCFLGRTVETTGQKLAELVVCDGGAKRGVERACAGDDYPRLGLWGSPSKPEAKTELGCAVNTQIRSVCGCLVCEAARPSRHFRIQSERQYTQREGTVLWDTGPAPSH